MSPEIAVAIVGAIGVVLAALVTAAVPLLRRTHSAVAEEGAATRVATLDAVSAMGSRLEARFNARVDDVRDDIDGVREDVARVREWQAGHDAEHLIIGQPRTGGTDT
ncbi:hypothetical protein ACWCO0_09675 [Streptomyces tubercidicus]